MEGKRNETVPKVHTRKRNPSTLLDGMPSPNVRQVGTRNINAGRREGPPQGPTNVLLATRTNPRLTQTERSSGSKTQGDATFTQHNRNTEHSKRNKQVPKVHTRKKTLYTRTELPALTYDRWAHATSTQDDGRDHHRTLPALPRQQGPSKTDQATIATAICYGPQLRGTSHHP